MTTPDQIVSQARSLVGAEYRHLGRGPLAYDCLGVVLEVCHRLDLVAVDFDFTNYTQRVADYELQQHLEASTYLEKLSSWREAQSADILLQRFHSALPASHLILITMRQGDALWGVHASNRGAARRVIEQRIAHLERNVSAYRLKEVARG